MKKLQVPFNLDLKVLDIYKEYSDYISEIYFSLHPSIFPSARQNEYPEINEYNDILFTMCKEMKAYGINPMVTLNGIKIDYSNYNLLLLYHTLKELKSFGLSGAIVADPILCHWIHLKFPKFKIRLSVLSGIKDLNKIKEIEKLGYIQEICLPQDLNRNEDMLKLLTSNTSIKYSTIVNSLCRINCPLFYWHQNAYCSNGLSWKKEDTFEMKEAFNSLNSNFTENWLKAPFILPNELNYYDQYFNTFKLEDRTLPTEKISLILKYYATRVNPDHLLDCISGSCIYLTQKELTNYPEQWLIYRRNCKGECWKCSYCDKIMEEN